MRIHSDTLTRADLYSAALIARVSLDLTEHGSRSRDRAFNVTLRGESRRKPNYGTSRNADRFGPDKAATWDQWGVFLAVLFEADANREPSLTMTIPRAYADAEAFADHTADRFGAPEDTMSPDGYVRNFVSYGWPEDAHGDHRFNYQGVPREQGCNQCSALTRVPRWVRP